MPFRDAALSAASPALAQERGVPDVKEGSVPSAALPPYRVLVVDDNVPLADSFVRLLHAGGCDPRVAADGETALRIAREFQPEVVFLDLSLPDMNGYEVARRLRSQPTLRNALLVAMTGYGRSGDERLAEDTGFQHYLVKPVRMEAVERLLREYQGPPT